jgi:hypothetical protein
MRNHARANGPHVHQAKDDPISWHPAFVEAIQLVLGPYRDVLQFLPEYQLNAEPLRIDLVVVKKTQDVVIGTPIAAGFREHNILEFKSPADHIAVADFYKVYGYACFYAFIEKVPITGLTITIVGSRYPRNLLGHLKKARGYTVEERSPGIYTVTGDIIPIQVIDTQRLTGEENIWLRDLDNKLDVERINEITAKIGRLGTAARVAAYYDVITRANMEKVEEAYQMRKKTMGFFEMLEHIGVFDEAEAKGEATKALEVAKNLITRIGLPLEQVADATGLDLETVQTLADGSRGL